MNFLRKTCLLIGLVLLISCGGDETTQSNFSTMSDFSEQSSEQPVPSMQQAQVEPTGREILNGVLTAQNATISDLQKNALAARLQQMIDAGTDSNLQMAMIIAANPQLRDSVIEGDIALALAKKVGEAKKALAEQTDGDASIGEDVLAFVGTYRGITNEGPFKTDSTTLVFELDGQSLKITDNAFFSGTCIFSGDVTGSTFTSGTYRCADFTDGSWSLSQARTVDKDDIYLEIVKDGVRKKWIYGMSSKANDTLSPIEVEDISSFVGTYDGINNRSSFPTDSTDIGISLSGSTLTIRDEAFFSGTCIYRASVTGEIRSTIRGAYQCSDFTEGSWELRQMKAVGTNDVYVSILKDGNNTNRLYGVK